MLPYRAVIFDMDGVLCRTDRLHYAAWVRFTDKYRLPFSEAFYETMLGRGREASMDMVLGEWGKTLSAEQKDALILEKNEIFLSLLRELTPDSAAPGVRETLTALRRRGVRLALGSSKMRSTLLTSLTIQGDRAVMAGKGYGHGVGMPQWGAYALAEEGMSAEEIVTYYFRDVTVEKLW